MIKKQELKLRDTIPNRNKRTPVFTTTLSHQFPSPARTPKKFQPSYFILQPSGFSCATQTHHRLRRPTLQRLANPTQWRHRPGTDRKRPRRRRQGTTPTPRIGPYRCRRPRARTSRTLRPPPRAHHEPGQLGRRSQHKTALPAIRILDCEEVPDDFHARFAALSKTYTYDLATTPILPPLLAGLAWHLPRQLDPDTLEEALALFRGTHDFRAFAATRGNETEGTDYSRTISEAAAAPTATGYQLTFTGNGFLYKMVRLLTGSAVTAAQGRLRLDDLADFLDQSPDFPYGMSPLCSPPDGLSLASVDYTKK